MFQTVEKQNKQLEALKAQLNEKQIKIDQQQAVIVKSRAVASATPLLSPNTQLGWRSDPNQSAGSSSWNNGFNAVPETRMSASPQYPHKLPGKPLLQPSKLKLGEDNSQQSNSYVVASSKAPSVNAQYQETQSTDTMQYLYGSGREIYMSGQLLSAPDVHGSQLHNMSTFYNFSKQPCMSSMQTPVSKQFINSYSDIPNYNIWDNHGTNFQPELLERTETTNGREYC